MFTQERTVCNALFCNIGSCLTFQHCNNYCLNLILYDIIWDGLQMGWFTNDLKYENMTIKTTGNKQTKKIEMAE